MKRLNIEIKEYNDEIDRVNEHKNKYANINYKLAYKEIEHEYSNFNDKKNEYKSHSLKSLKCTNLIKKLKSRIKKLKIKQAQTSIALEMMNRELALIFFDKDRLVLSEKNKHYEILVRGKNIPLSKL